MSFGPDPVDEPTQAEVDEWDRQALRQDPRIVVQDGGRKMGKQLQVDKFQAFNRCVEDATQQMRERHRTDTLGLTDYERDLIQIAFDAGVRFGKG